MKTKQGWQYALATDWDDKRVVLFTRSGFLGNQKRLVPDRRIPVDCIGCDSQVERTLDLNEEFNG
jgi:hypothetical protein